MLRWLPVLLLAASSMPAPARATDEAHAARARALFASAQRRLATGIPAQNQFARTELEDATKLDPGNHQIAFALGSAYLASDMLHRALDLARHLIETDSTYSGARLLEGLVWRRKWLTEAEDPLRDRAILSLVRGAKLAPGDSACWTALVPLLVDADELELAKTAATYSLRAAPGRPGLVLQMAGVEQRIGELETADRLFHEAIPKLPAATRARLLDIAPLLPPQLAVRYAALRALDRARYEEDFWRAEDPDPVTEVNEARLEYWARVTQAIALYGEPRHTGEWDMRAQMYARYGRPEAAAANVVSIDMPTGADLLNWYYPSLGMSVQMVTGSALTGFSSPISRSESSPRAREPALANREDLDSVNRGWAVFHRLPPGVEPLDARLSVACFETSGAPSLLAEAEAAGGPASHLTAEWTVLDSASAPVLHSTTAMAASACQPDQARAASLTAALAPGRYRVCVHVTDDAGRLGVLRRETFVPEDAGGLALSDLVVTCSSAEQSVVPGSGVRLEPNTGLFPEGDGRLNAYFEIYHLLPNGGGDARFEYDCVVRPVVEDTRGWLSRVFIPKVAAPIEVSRRETTHGSLRRQFLTVPVASLPPGRYEIELRVRDLLAGTESVTWARFVRGGDAATGKP